jgi:hypothetical protein
MISDALLHLRNPNLKVAIPLANFQDVRTLL